MGRLQQRDYYFGAGLSLFFRANKDSRPVLIEPIGDTSQLLQMTTDASHKDFVVFMKYTVDSRILPSTSERRWAFSLQKADKEIINRYIKNNTPIFIFFIGGFSRFTKEGEIAVLTSEEYLQISEKSTITVKTSKNAKTFHVQTGKKQKQYFCIPRNRIERSLFELQTAP